MGKYHKLSPPKRGSKITVAKNGQLQVPDDPIVPFVQGEGIAPETWSSCQAVFEAAVDRCYGNAKRLEWLEVFAGERGNEVYGPNSWLPEDTIRAIQEYKVCIKGPLTTPVGVPKSLDAQMRERLDLFARTLPIRYIDGVPSPLAVANEFNLVIFREHNEDMYSEIEWKKGSPEAKQLINFVNNDMSKKPARTIRPDSSVGIKPISATATKRVMRLAIDYAIKHKRKSVTFVHKGNHMKLTEGFFRDWGYELARKEFNEYVITEQEVNDEHNGVSPRGRVIIRDRLADQVILDLVNGTDDYDVIATTSSNGDYLASVARSLVSDAGLSPTAYVGAKAAIFQSTPEASPRFAEANSINPSSVLLAGVMLFEHLGWKDAAELVASSLIRTISDGTVTADLARRIDGAKLTATDEFCDRLIDNFEEVHKTRVRNVMQRAAGRL